MNDTDSPSPRYLYGIIGSPVSHSLSPLLHNTGFRLTGHPGAYYAWDVPKGDAGRFLDAMRTLGIAGASVTIPHKEDALRLADTASDRARLVGAANTLVCQDGRIHADNTDVDGFLRPLRDTPIGPDATVLLLGAGGAARAAAVGLRERGAGTVWITSPSGTSAPRLAEEFGYSALGWDERGTVLPDIVVNTTPLGMTGSRVDETPYPAHMFAGRQGIVFDTVYTPLRTRLLREGELAGWRTVTGLGMFLGQGDRQFRLWTGQGLPDGAVQAVVQALYGDDVDATGITF